MGGSSKLDKLKAMQKEGKKGIVVDKTFGLKNKNKSKKVQQFCKQVQETQNKNKGIDAESKKKKKMSKLAKLQQEMELKALFSEGLSITVKKKDLHKKKNQESSGGGGGGGDYYDENWVPRRRPCGAFDLMSRRWRGGGGVACPLDAVDATRDSHAGRGRARQGPAGVHRIDARTKNRKKAARATRQGRQGDARHARNLQGVEGEEGQTFVSGEDGFAKGRNFKEEGQVRAHGAGSLFGAKGRLRRRC